MVCTYPAVADLVHGRRSRGVQCLTEVGVADVLVLLAQVAVDGLGDAPASHVAADRTGGAAAPSFGAHHRAVLRRIAARIRPGR